ncbi:MAG: hypothetical protein ACUVUC_14560 [Thermoguttaceae bacterium]
MPHVFRRTLTNQPWCRADVYSTKKLSALLWGGESESTRVRAAWWLTAA